MRIESNSLAISEITRDGLRIANFTAYREALTIGRGERAASQSEESHCLW